MRFSSIMQDVEVIKADLSLPAHQDAVLALVNAYCSDPMGNGRPLAGDARGNLIAGLRSHPTTLIFLAFHRENPIGIAVCFRGFSTFSARPLVNIHDLFVVPEMRGRGLAGKLLSSVEAEARCMDCCKLTLEVLENNMPARKAYRSFGFAQAQNLPEAGGALFMDKPLRNQPPTC